MITPSQIEAAARALHRFNAPRVGNSVAEWEQESAPTQGRWMKQALLALEAATRVERSEANTPVVVSRE